MMHSCKFYSFLRDQSLEKWVKYIKILIINKRFYLLTEIFRQPAKIEKFNRLPGGVGHGPRDQFCPITSLQMAD